MNKSALAKKESPMSMSPIKNNLPPMPVLSLVQQESFRSGSIQLDQTGNLQEQLAMIQDKLKKTTSTQSGLSPKKMQSQTEKAELEKLQQHLHELE